MAPRENGPRPPGPLVGLRRALLSAAATLPVLAAAAPAAGAADLGPLTRATGVSPFADCTADRVAQQTGDNYRNTEIEPWLAANPTNARNLLLGVQQDRWSNGGARGTVVAFSRNGGTSWETVAPPGISLCSGGRYQRSSDPWVDFSPDGTAYFMSLVTDNDPPSGEFGKNGMVVNRSTDGGETWSRSIQLSALPIGPSLDDKNSLTADPTNSNFAYAVWDRLTDFTLVPPRGGSLSEEAESFAAATGGRGGIGGANVRARWLRERAAARAGARTQAAEVFFTGPAYLARTRDGGRSWQDPKVIYDPGPNSQTIGNQIVVTPSGTLVNFFAEILPNGSQTVRLIRSFDKGRTFERRPRTVASIAFSSTGTLTPDEELPVRDAAFLPDVAVDPDTGVLYAIWQDTRFRSVDEIAFSLSTDGGNNWTRPVRINKTPAAGNPFRQQAFIPSIAVGPGGRLVVTYYDFRNDRGGGEELTDHFAVVCSANCDSAASWGGELKLTARSFDYLDAPVARGLFLGDYMGLARAGGAVHALWGVPVAENRTNLFTRKITFGSGGAAAAGPVASLGD